MVKRFCDGAYRLWSGDLTLFGAPVLDEMTAGRFRAEQISNVIRYTSAVMMANIFNALALVIALWGTAILGAVQLWAFVVITSSTFLYLRRRADASRSKPTTASPRVIRRSAIYALIMGLLWGFVPLFFFEDASSQGQLVILCLTTGMICGGAFALSTIPTAAIAFMSPIVAGFAITVLHMRQPVFYLVAGLSIVYAFVLIRAVSTHTLHLLQRVLAQVESEQAAHTDPLTNLPNRVAFREKLSTALSRLSRYGEGFGLLYIDLDNFKTVNDGLGHAAGDDLLIQAGDRMKACMREIDCVARLAGDEFAIIAGGVKEASQAAIVAERLIRAFSTPFTVGTEKVMARASIGIAVAPYDGIDAETLLRKSDAALYNVKRDRRGEYQFFQSEIDAKAQQQRAMERELREAVANGELELVFQPIMTMATHQVSGFEALVRWNHPTRGIVAPLDFIPIAERTGAIQEIGEFVIGEALRAAKTWPEHLRIAVNFSPEQLRSFGIVPLVRELLDDFGVAPSRL
jgi:diguanylate cyclase (GGDEF)-like protein